MKDFFIYLFEGFTKDAFEKMMLGFLALVLVSVVIDFIVTHYKDILAILFLAAIFGAGIFVSWVVGHLIIRLLLKK